MNHSKKHGILKKNEHVFFANNEEPENYNLVVSETPLFSFQFLRFYWNGKIYAYSFSHLNKYHHNIKYYEPNVCFSLKTRYPQATE